MTTDGEINELVETLERQHVGWCKSNLMRGRYQRSDCDSANRAIYGR